ncbi:MAG: copper amine oxidase N-terminal domain-containing protein, partial [Firmicutes bacterium]|nr:copper amine oxidase N-terminal domain-containing protein [Bacillota bacterium]
MKKMKFARKITVLSIFLISAFFITSVYAANISERDLKKISSIVSENWSDDYIGYMSLTVGSNVLETDGDEVELDAAPVIKDGTLMIPIRAVVEESGGTIEYSNGIVTIEESGTKIEMSAQSSAYTKNDEEKEFTQSPYVSGGRTYVPLRNVTEDLGFEVNWESSTKTVTLTRDFQTMRVIASGNIDTSKYDTKEILELPGNVYVLQFESIDSAKECCSELEADKNVAFAEAD